MATYTVHVPPGVADPIQRADRTIFVREGFNWWAFLFGPLFLLFHRAWIATILWFILIGAASWSVHALRLPVDYLVWLIVLAGLFLGLEGNGIRRDVLERRGFRFADVVFGWNREAGERAFFLALPVRNPVPRAAVGPLPGGNEVLGLFPEAGDAR